MLRDTGGSGCQHGGSDAGRHSLHLAAVLRLVWLAWVLGGCSWLSGPHAPVVSATEGGISVAAAPGEIPVAAEAGPATQVPFETLEAAEEAGGSGSAPGLDYCRNLYDALEDQSRSRQVMDGGERRLPQYPFLRTDRFLASFGADFLDALDRTGFADREAAAARMLQTPAFHAWLTQMQRLDVRVRRLEVSRLAAQSFPLYHQPDQAALMMGLLRCGPVLVNALTPSDVPKLLVQAQVPDEYQRSLRAMGLYPLTGIGVAQSIRNWEEHQRQVFRAQQHARLPARATYQRYRPARTLDGASAWRAAAGVMRAVPRDALGIPQFSAAQRETLFAAFAPSLEIVTASDSDRIGLLQWIDLAGLVRHPDERFWLDVDTTVPAVYQRLSFTRFGQAVLPQLVYTVWFSERPAAYAGDLQAGRLDGLVWRVTLDQDGAPLVYDTIQPSGRFAMFFPTRRLVPAGSAPQSVERLAEWVYSPIDVAVEDWVGQTWVGPLSLHVSSRTHQLVGIGRPEKAWGRPEYDNPPYRQVSEDVLRALPVPGMGRRSIYNQEGIVAGTERLGRWLFWSMGVSDMGSVRQPGRQPTALVGRRHFDDAHLFEQRYQRVPVPGH